ncbi:Eco57I restriction-modification methylase domain-containing protein [Corynebacterium diphtheriae]|uniref:Eco57I restriction-modification methylase domain-containing protein n=1 Tax=Corynebacterium diphtheriae TaxID=1717 RepID=UPI000EB0AC07|nr:Eco57I restriction-modification methylase domain-containing protein [Corynebacterium diphtheriae]RKW93787.1 restriction endonuclease [Corynebacterium diphtheriae]
MSLLQRAEQRRIDATHAIGLENLAKSEQFFTPVEVAQLMAERLIPNSNLPETISLLDPGAGPGILTSAAVDRLTTISPNTRIHIVAVEKDTDLIPQLTQTLEDCVNHNPNVTYEIHNTDFIYWGTNQQDLFKETPEQRKFDLCIQNPPYAKLPANSPESTHLKAEGIHAPNLYAAFLAIAKTLLTDRGRLTAITPRSFYNGTYFTRFRQFMFDTTSIESIHTFESRREVFKDTGVLQESIITTFISSKETPENVELSTSRSQAHDVSSRTVDYNAVVVSDVIFVPATDKDKNAVAWMSNATATLAELPFNVSTGRVVDFRSRDKLTTEPTPNTVPIVYPAHFNQQGITHPKPTVTKPQYYISDDIENDKSLVPAGSYVLVKRFSAKEEKRRIVAAVWDGPIVAFDNKTNFFHSNGQGLDPELAVGLAMWLNSTHVDDFFRVFSGHTQVNAGDLKMMPYPTVEQLRALAALQNKSPDETVSLVFGS